jgi:hypothetical protein
MAYGDGMDPSLYAETKKEHPLFCDQCRSHGLLDLRRKAIQRMHLKKRSAETQGASTVKETRKAASDDVWARLQDHVADNNTEPPEVKAALDSAQSMGICLPSREAAPEL